jgi:hypothetical protein
VHKRLRSAFVLVAIATLSAACGGGGNGPKLTGTTTSKPTSGATGTTARPTSTLVAATTTTAVPTTPTVFTTTPAGSVPGPAKLSDASQVTTAGLGALTFGLTVPVAEKAIGTRLLPDTAFAASGQCIVLKPEAGVDAVWFTVTKSTVERLDVRPPSKVKTRSGAGVASTEAQLKTLFADRLTTTAKPDGKTIVYTPQDAANANFRIIFELDLAGAVTSYRAGRVGAVEPLTPCS